MICFISRESIRGTAHVDRGAIMPKHREIDRRTFVGGSDARVIMGSDEAPLVRLWQEKRGEAEPQDLSRDLPVQLGRATEDLNRRWFEQETKHG